MFVRPTLFLFLFTAVLASSLSLDFAAAQERPGVYSEFGYITGLEAGWRDDTMAVSLKNVPVVNSGEVVLDLTIKGAGGYKIIPCAHTDAGYALDPKDPGVKLHEAVLLSAFLAGRKVRVLVQGCIYDKPRIIAVGIGDPPCCQ